VKDLATAVDSYSSSKDIAYIYDITHHLPGTAEIPREADNQTHDWTITTRGRNRTEFTLVRTGNGLKVQKRDQMVRD
jgi:hypothetical protein